MPNHITNRIKLIGEPAEIRRVMEAVKVDKIGLGSLDFEKIIPMPADVDDSYNWCISNWGTKWIYLFLQLGLHPTLSLKSSQQCSQA